MDAQVLISRLFSAYSSGQLGDVRLLLQEVYRYGLIYPNILLIDALTSLAEGNTIRGYYFLEKEIERYPFNQQAYEIRRGLHNNFTPSRPRCLIIGNDGFDNCTLGNLIILYTSLGFQVQFSRTVEPCELLVLKRFNPGYPIEVAGLHPCTPIHVYSYVGNNPDDLPSQVKTHPVSVFAPSEELLPRTFESLNVILPTPVYPELWQKQGLERVLKYVHIGNLKSADDGLSDDAWSDRQDLLTALCHPQAHVWGGTQWKEVAGIKNFYGPASIVEVSSIYAVTQYALGLMYPSQLRQGTYSSRFWQAPLCGVPLFCEKRVRHQFPGIYSVGLDKVEEKIKEIPVDPVHLQREAYVFWKSRWYEALDTVFSSLERFPIEVSSLKSAPENSLSIGEAYTSLLQGKYVAQNYYF